MVSALNRNRVTAPRSIRFNHRILECHAFRVVLRKPCFGSVDVSKHLEMVGVADLLAGVDVDEDCHCLVPLEFPVRAIEPRSGPQDPRDTPAGEPSRIPRSGNKMRKRKARMPAP